MDVSIETLMATMLGESMQLECLHAFLQCQTYKRS